jgi:hypothetical protein
MRFVKATFTLAIIVEKIARFSDNGCACLGFLRRGKIVYTCVASPKEAIARTTTSGSAVV